MGWEWLRRPLYWLRVLRARRRAWEQLFPAGRAAPLQALSPQIAADARKAGALLAGIHAGYLGEFNALTARAREIFENREWTQGSIHAEYRVQLYRSAVNGAWRKLQRLAPEQAADPAFWMGVRQAFLESVFPAYETDLAMTFFYSVMRLAFDDRQVPIEYADDGLAERPHFWRFEPVWRLYRAHPASLFRPIRQVLRDCGFHAAFQDFARDAARVAERLLGDWAKQFGSIRPRDLQILKPVFFRDREAYIVGKLRAGRYELPVVLALQNEVGGIVVDAVLTGREDMRNILFVSTRSTFDVRTDDYREVLAFLNTIAPERGHPAMCAVLGFTHPARVALNQSLRRHLRQTGERFMEAPGRPGMAMVVFTLPSFPYVFKVVRDFSSKRGWTGRARVMTIYRWVHEINRGRLMLDAWLYRNLLFPRQAFAESVLADLLATAPGSVHLEGETVLLRHVYAQRRVRPLATFFEETRDRGTRERAIDALGMFIKDLASMGFFMGDHYGLCWNTGLTHGFNVTLYDFDDLAPLPQFRFRETPPLENERDELLWNTETDGAWFAVDESDVLVDEWERYLGVPPDLRDYFRERHGDLFTLAYWDELRRRVLAGGLHSILPYPAERRLAGRR